MDVLPTLVKIAGVAVPDTPKIDGRDIMPILTNQTATSPHQAYYYFGPQRLRAVRSGDFKLDIMTNRLYNVVRNPAETINVAASNPAVMKKIKGYITMMARDLGTNFTNCGPGCRSPGSQYGLWDEMPRGNGSTLLRGSSSAERIETPVL
jgi:arylsulfatase A-like enzyme